MSKNNIKTQNILEGIVTKIYGTVYSVADKERDIYNCVIKGSYRQFKKLKDRDDKLYSKKKKLFQSAETRNPLAVGDYVRFVPNGGKGTIIEILPRKNKLARSHDTTTFQSEKKKKRYDRQELIKEQIIATNLDFVLTVNAVKTPEVKTGLIDRMIIACEKENIEPVIVLNKIDLDPDFEVCDRIKGIYESIGYKVFTTSALSNIGIIELKDFIRGKTIIFSGHSGVGKSSLINAVVGEDLLKTSETSTYHKKGKHTTTNTELLQIPDGGYLIDSPGTKLFGIYNINPADIQYYYKEFKPYIDLCKYKGCMHTGEDGCAVYDAVEKGEIEKERYENYLRIIENPSGKY